MADANETFEGGDRSVEFVEPEIAPDEPNEELPDELAEAVQVKAMMNMEFLLLDEESVARLSYWVTPDDEAHFRLFVPREGQDGESDEDRNKGYADAAYAAIRLAMEHMNELALKMKHKADGLD